MAVPVLIIVTIIVVIVIIKSNKKKKAIEELKNSKLYELAEKIKEELEKNGFNKLGEPRMDFFINGAHGNFTVHNPKYIVSINFYSNRSDFNSYKSTISYQMKTSFRNRMYGLENDNIGILVYIHSENEFSEDVPKPIKIAAIATEVIENNGYGQCKVIE